MPDIDIRTVILALCVGNMVAVLLLLAYAPRPRSGRSMRLFIVGKTAQSLAWLMLGLRGLAPDWMSLNVANILLMGGFACEAWAVAALRLRTAPCRGCTFAVLTGLGLLLLGIAGVTQPVTIRVALISALGVALCCVPGLALWRARDASALQRLVGGLYLAAASALVLRCYAGLFSDSISLMSAGAVQVLNYAILYVLMLLGSLGFLLLAMEDVVNDLRRAATHDDLTGLLNRRAFMDQAGRLMDLASRTGHPVTMFSMDLDHFKGINDTWGHQVGDEVLRDFAATALKVLRRTDLLARMGGEEFVALLSDTGTEAARAVAERIRADVEASRPRPGLVYTVSVGLDSLEATQGARDLGDMLRRSDEALYAAKEQGRNRVAARADLRDASPLVSIDQRPAERVS